MTTQPNNPSRRTLLAGIAAAPALAVLGTAAEATPIPDDELSFDYNEGFKDGEENGWASFALIWLRLFTMRGGSVTMDTADPDKAWIGWPVGSMSPLSEEPNPALPEEVRSRCRAALADRYEGEMRALHAIIVASPEGLKQVKAWVRTLPELGRRPMFDLSAEG